MEDYVNVKLENLLSENKQLSLKVSKLQKDICRIQNMCSMFFYIIIGMIVGLCIF